MYSLFPLKRDGNRREAIALQHSPSCAPTENAFDQHFASVWDPHRPTELSPHLGERIEFAGAIKGDAKEGDFSDRLR